MLKRICVLLAILVMVGCAHRVDFQTPESRNFENVVPMKAAFYMSQDLKNKVYSGRAFSSGIVHRWDVPVGKVTSLYAISNIKKGFAGFKEVDSDNDFEGNDILIKITDIKYYMKGQAAHITVTIAVLGPSGNEIFKKSYKADGPSGYGRVMLGGAFAQKSAIRQSSNVAFNTIFNRYMDDVNSHYREWR